MVSVSAHATATSSLRLYLRMQLQLAHCACICACNCNQLTVPVSAHATATSSQRIGSRSASRASQHIVSHPVQRSAPRECNQLAAPVSAHANATSSPRLYLRMQMQPARRARRTAHTSHLQLCTRFAVLCAGFGFRLVRGTNFSKIQFIYIANCNFVMCS
jgi:hypothetical protein